jgi:zinc protease
MTINRLQSPELITPDYIPVIRAADFVLDNGLRVYAINAGTEDVIKLDIIFPSGATGQSNYSIASACHQLLDTGTSSKKAIDIAEAFDFYGSYLQTDFGPDWKTISLFSLTRFFPETAANLMEIMEDAVYPESELESWKTRSIQTLKVNREKVSWLAKTAFQEALFGSNHPYGITTSESDILNLSADALRLFFKEEYPIEKAIIIISGKVDSQAVKTLNNTLGKKTIKGLSSQKAGLPEIANTTPSKRIIEKKDAVQSGVRIGKRMFSKNHPDYPALQIVNTVLGGYFGSRLMSNIREDKGYTYGIGSGVHPHLNAGYFFISTEVGTDVREPAIAEIYKELTRLSKEPVPADELLLVKNYLIGSFQRSLDGPFSLADRFRGIHLFHLDYNYLDAYLKLLHTITPEKFMEIAFNHLQPDSMTEIIAG